MNHPSYPITRNGLTHQTSPDWLVVIWRFQDPRVGYKATNVEPLSLTFPIIIRSDAISVGVNRPKGSYKKQANIQLLLTDLNYINEVKPYDYVGIWMANSADKIDEIEQAFSSGASYGTLNDFKSGFKFLGKVTSVSEGASVSVNGMPTNTASIEAEMFSELDTSVFFTSAADKYIVSPGANLGSSQYFLSKVDKNGLEDLVKNNTRGWNYPNEVIKFFLRVFLGSGPQQILKDAAPIRAENGFEVKPSFNSEMLVPRSVASVLGFSTNKTYVETLYIDTGIEQYQVVGNRPAEESFSPAGLRRNFPFRDSTDLKGYCQITAAPWNNTALQSIVSMYLNDVCNEMFTCMRFDPVGGIRPTIVARQIPFTTNFIKQLMGKKNAKTFGNDGNNTAVTAKLPEVVENEVKKSQKYTYFANLPRWIVDKSVTMNQRFGLSDSMRVNYVQVISNQFQSGLSVGSSLANGASQEFQKTKQFILGNFVYDEGDIKRHGLRALIKETPFDSPFTTTSATFFSPIWAVMLADWVFNSHLKLSGQLSMMGVQEPICEGDNVQYGDHVFHIEAINHQCQITSDGSKSFTTNLSLSNGMVAKDLDGDSSSDLYGNSLRGQLPQTPNATLKNFNRSYRKTDTRNRKK